MRIFCSRFSISILTCASMLVTLPVFAHHSSAMFDATKVIELQGTIKEIQWTNPHAWIQVNATDKDGHVVEWSFETEGPYALSRAGFKKNSLMPGDKVDVKAHPLKDGRHGGSLVSIMKADGSVFSLDASLRRPPKSS